MIIILSSLSSLLVEQYKPINVYQWDEIIKDIIVFSDTIWLHRSSVVFDSEIDIPIQRHYETVYKDLINAGVIHFYAFESDSDIECKQASRVITRDEHMILYNSIIEKVQNPDNYTLDSMQDPERTSRIVEKRNELWKFGLATILNSELMLSRKYGNCSLATEINNRSINSMLTYELFSAFEISHLTHLEAKDIIDLKNKAQKHKNLLRELTVKAMTTPDATLSDVVNGEFKATINNINILLSDVAGNNAIKKLIANTLINVGGLIPFSTIVLIPLTAIICGKDLYDFLSNRKKYGFILFMNSLKSRSINS